MALLARLADSAILQAFAAVMATIFLLHVVSGIRYQFIVFHSTGLYSVVLIGVLAYRLGQQYLRRT